MRTACCPRCCPRGRGGVAGDPAFPRSKGEGGVTPARNHVDVASLEELVREVVQSRRAQLEQLVHQALDAELGRLLPEIVEAEIAQRQDGGAPVEAEPPPQTRRCPGCHEQRALDDFAKGKSRCRSCRSAEHRRYRARRAERERAAADDEEPHTVTPTVRKMRGGMILGPMQLAAEQERRELIAELRANGREYDEATGFRVLRLPPFEPDGQRARPMIEPRSFEPRPVA